MDHHRPPGGARLRPEIGDPSPFRLLSPTLGAQVGWPLPLALFGLVGAALKRGPCRLLNRRGPALPLWGGWLLSAGAFLSVGYPPAGVFAIRPQP